MRWMQIALLFTSVSFLFSPASEAIANDSLSNSLTGFSGDSSQGATQAALAAAGLNVDADDSAPAVTFDAGGAHFGAVTPGDGGRNYMRTNLRRYARSLGFVAEITFETTTDDQAVFIGLGAGQTALFGTPDWSTLFSSASFWPETANNKFVRFRTQNDINSFGDTGVAGFDPGTHRFRMTFDSSTNQLLGAIDINYAGGPFVADAMTTNFPIVLTSLYAPDGWPLEPSRIFFGGDDGATFRDLSITVIPEPCSWLLILLGCAAIVGQRLRRNRS
jgi:hypothetical protein